MQSQNMFINISINIIVIVIVVLYIYIVYKVVLEKDIDRLVKMIKFNRTLLNALEKNRVEQSKEIINIYKGTYNINKKHGLYTDSLLQLLRTFLNKYFYKNKENKHITEEAKAIILDMIDKYESDFRYFDISNIDKTLLIDIKKFAEENKNDNIISKVHDLAQGLEDRTREMQSLKKTNRLSIIISIVSIVLGVYFGIKS